MEIVQTTSVADHDRIGIQLLPLFLQGKAYSLSKSEGSKDESDSCILLQMQLAPGAF